MKKDWLCRGSYDEKNQEIAPVMMTQWWSRSSDDPDPVMMIQQWWSKSSDDDPDRVMIQIRWWRWLEYEYDLKMEMAWRWRWQGIDDDPDDTEKKTCTDTLCRQNTFLVKRECWCNCKFRRYSSIYLMYCTPMVIPVCFCNLFVSCHAPMFILGSF